MIGAIEILIIAIIFGVIYGRDAIDRTWKKNPNEGVVESFTEDVHMETIENVVQTNPEKQKDEPIKAPPSVAGSNVTDLVDNVLGWTEEDRQKLLKALMNTPCKPPAETYKKDSFDDDKDKDTK